MRELFTVGVRLIGVLGLYWALKHIPVLVGSLGLRFVELPDARLVNRWWELMLVVLSLVVSLGFALATPPHLASRNWSSNRREGECG